MELLGQRVYVCAMVSLFVLSKTHVDIFFNCHIIVVLGVKCDIYKSSYNVS
jgi:hypothetical protein